MIRQRTMLGWVAAVAGLLVCLPALAGVNALYQAEWRDGDETGVQNLRLDLQFLPADLRVEATSAGVDIWLPGVQMDELPVDGLTLVHEEGGSRIRIDRPGAIVRSVSLSGGGTVTLALAGYGRGLVETGGYRIGVGDDIRVAVYKNEDLSGDFTVGPDGTITIPFVGRVSVVGKTESEITQAIASLLAEDYIVDPQVSVTVSEYRSQYAYVTGSIGRASRVPLRSGMNLRDVLSEAGVALAPGQKVVLTRTGKGGETRTLDGDELDEVTAPAPRDGDVLSVQEREYVFIQGEVRRPNKLVHDPGMTLLQAISMAEGLTEWASKKDVLILRQSEGSDRPEEVEVNLKKVEELRTPDPKLVPGDVIVVRRRFL